jgi:sec-independent protein translocase protein TatC
METKTANPGKVMPLLEHVRELRRSLLVCLCAFAAAMVVSFILSGKIINLFTRQFREVSSVVDTVMVASTIAEGFVTKLKITVIAGFILSLPVHVFEVIKFLFPALGKKERAVVLSFLVFSLLLIVVGVYLAYFKIVPLAVSFLTNPRLMPAGVGFLLNYQTNLFYVFSFMLWSILALQAPLLMEILLILNVLKRRSVLRASRFIIVAIFLVSALITPPDFVSQLGVALPLTFFYFLALLIAKIFRFGEG